MALFRIDAKVLLYKPSGAQVTDTHVIKPRKITFHEDVPLQFLVLMLGVICILLLTKPVSQYSLIFLG